MKIDSIEEARLAFVEWERRVFADRGPAPRTQAEFRKRQQEYEASVMEIEKVLFSSPFYVQMIDAEAAKRKENV